MESEMDFSKMENAEDVLVADSIKDTISSTLKDVDNIRNVIIIYEDKESYLNLAVAGFDNDWEIIGMLEESKYSIINGELK